MIIPKAIGLTDYGIDRVSTIYYKPEDVESCRKAIELALYDKTFVDMIGNRARQEVYTKFTEEQMALAVEEVINNVMNQ